DCVACTRCWDCKPTVNPLSAASRSPARESGTCDHIRPFAEESVMPSPNRLKPGRPHLQRDQQKWVFDGVIKETGKVFHFQSDGRGRLPRSVRSHDMIAKHMGQAARRTERLAQAESEAGHRETALELYYKATLQYHD